MFLMKKLFLDGGAPSADVSGSQNLTLPTETINVVPGALPDSGTKVDPFKASPEQLSAIEAELAGKTVEKPLDKEIPIETTEEPGKEIDLSEFEMDEAAEKAFLADMGPEFGKYSSVREALLDLYHGKSAIEPAYQRDHQIVERLNDIGKTLNLSPDEIIAGLSKLDPRNQAMPQGQPFQNFEKFISDYSGHIDFTGNNGLWGNFYRGFAGSLAADVISQIESRFGRYFNGYDGQIKDIRTERQIDKFTANPKNAEWVGRESEIRDALDALPAKYQGKPNSIDLAIRWLKAGAEPKPVKKQVAEQVRQKLQDIEAKKRTGHLEGPGRGMPTGKPITDPDKMPINAQSRKLLGDMIDDYESRGHALG